MDVVFEDPVELGDRVVDRVAERRRGSRRGSARGAGSGRRRPTAPRSQGERVVTAGSRRAGRGPARGPWRSIAAAGPREQDRERRRVAEVFAQHSLAREDGGPGDVERGRAEPAVDAGAEDAEDEQEHAAAASAARGWRSSSGGRATVGSAPLLVAPAPPQDTRGSLATGPRREHATCGKALLRNEGCRRSRYFSPEGLLSEYGPSRPHPAHSRCRWPALGLLALWAGGADGAALVKVGNLVLQADGGFEPAALPATQLRADRLPGPRRHRTTDGGARRRCSKRDRLRPRRAARARAGCRSARPAQIENATTAGSAARLRGRDRRHRHDRRDDLLLERRPVPASSPLTLFNGPPPGRQPDRRSSTPASPSPSIQTFAIVDPDRTRAAAATATGRPSTSRRSPAARRRSPTSTPRSAAATSRRRTSAATSPPAAPTASSAPTAASPSPTARSSTAASKSPARR